MKAVVLAAGRGTRMGVLTESLPKPLISVKGKPFLFYVLKNLEAAGIDDVAVIVGYKKQQVIDFLLDHDFRVTVITQPVQLGTGHAVRMASPFVRDENFLVLGGDNLWSVRDVKAMMQEDDECYVGVKEVKNPEKYGVCLINDDVLSAIVEKPKEFVGNLVNTGLLKLTPDIFAALQEIPKSVSGEYYLTDAITLLAQRGKVRIVRLQDDWLDLGCPEDIPTVEEKLGLLC